MNITHRNNFYILTGGPGSGKSSIIGALKNLGYVCISEVGRQIIQEQTRISGDALHTKNQVKFCDLMLSRSIHTYEDVKEKHQPVFFDRGIPDLIGYCLLIKSDASEYLHNAVKSYRYNKKVFIAPPWEEIYAHDEERKQSWSEAVDTYHHIAAGYLEAGHELIELPKASMTERVKFILSQI